MPVAGASCRRNVMPECPAKERLEQLLPGGLSAAEEEVLIDHVEECPRCRDTLQALVTADTPPGLARPSSPGRGSAGSPRVNRCQASLGRVTPFLVPTPAADYPEGEAWGTCHEARWCGDDAG